jgi:hypothetical protein
MNSIILKRSDHNHFFRSMNRWVFQSEIRAVSWVVKQLQAEMLQQCSNAISASRISCRQPYGRNVLWVLWVGLPEVSIKLQRGITKRRSHCYSLQHLKQDGEFILPLFRNPAFMKVQENQETLKLNGCIQFWSLYLLVRYTSRRTYS